MDYYDDDDDWYDEQRDEGPQFMPEMGAIERVGMPGGGYIGAKPMNRIERAMMDPLERFRQYVDAISRQLRNWDGVNISEGGIDSMLEKAAQLQAVNHKNPTAYVLGYVVTGGGRKLKKDLFDNMMKKALPHVQDTSVLAPDIIRYARLWENMN